MTCVMSLDLEPRSDLPPFQAPRWLPRGTPCRSFVTRRDGFPESLAGCTHLLLSGSTASIVDDLPWARRAEELVRDAVAAGLPVLGICYGHQLLARALLGPAHVRRAAVPEMGWLDVHPNAGFEALFAGLPAPFRAFVGHFDEVCCLPPGWDVTAHTADGPVHGLLCRELRLMGFQFHPEMDLDVGNACYRIDRKPLEALGFDVGRILRDGRDDGSGAVLIPRFLSHSW